MVTENNQRGEGRGIKFLRLHLEDSDGPCLIWPLFRDPDTGYGRMGFEGQQLYAHRVMCELVNGAPPTPKHQAGHSCGKGHEGCVHPRHLSWKTNTENQLDRTIHNTWVVPGKPKFRLTEEKVARIREIGNSMTKTDLAKMFDVSRDTIAKVLTFKTWPTGRKRSQWGYEPGDPRNPFRRGNPSRVAKATNKMNF